LNITNFKVLGLTNWEPYLNPLFCWQKVECFKFCFAALLEGEHQHLKGVSSFASWNHCPIKGTGID